MQFHAMGHPADAEGIEFFGCCVQPVGHLGAKCISGMHFAIHEPGYVVTAMAKLLDWPADGISDTAWEQAQEDPAMLDQGAVLLRRL